MSAPTSNQIRRQFIDYFVEKCGHTFVPSSPCVPHDDPTLMFTNAGMNQFKDVFLGTGTRPYRRAANTQKCIRAGGKHNDLDDVGHDTYHHTFFEMLGNWSFGDYFKKEAIEWAWDLLTKVWGVDPQRLHATYFGGLRSEPGRRSAVAEAQATGVRSEPAAQATGDWILEPDSETRDLWLKILPPERVHPGGMKDNFWEMGDTGPCGPCSEIHIDLTADKSGGPLVNAGDARVMEIWNLVFIQFNAAWLPNGEAAVREFEKIQPADGWNGNENEGRRQARIQRFGTADRNEFISRNRSLTPLPAKHVDTGMGFERITSLLQGKKSNYDTDIFTPIFAAIQSVTGAPAYTGKLEAPSDQSRDRQGAPSDPQIMIDVAYRVTADHLRTLTFALTDGATPSNEGRGYVLRRILRRAVRYGRQYLITSGQSSRPDARPHSRPEARPHARPADPSHQMQPFIWLLVPAVVDCMGEAFPELKKNPQYVAEVIREEEQSFVKTLDRGIALFDECVTRAIRIASGDYVTEKNQSDPPTPELFATGKWIHPREVELYSRAGKNVIPGEAVFKLHDTYGFPVDLTELMAAERGLVVEIDEYERLMEEAREKARGTKPFSSLQKTASALFDEQKLRVAGPTDDHGKYFRENVDGKVMGFIRFDAEGDSYYARGFEGIQEGEEAGIILDKSCFYAEQGGQVGDAGLILGTNAQFTVEQTQKHSSTVVHYGTVTKGAFRFGEVVRAIVDGRRVLTKANHTATHVMNWALREVLGDHVQQKGSLVDPDKTRFDFSHPSQVTEDQLTRIEELVNSQIEEDLEVFTAEADQKKAREINTLRAVFGEKYPDRVRVVSVGVPVDQLQDDPTNDEWMRYSVEFCGGTHVKRTSEIGRFRLVEESAVAKGIRRVTGITADKAHAAERAAAALSKEIEEALRAGRSEPGARATGSRNVEQSVAAIQARLANTEFPVVEKNRLRSRLAELQELAKKAAKQQAKAGAADIVAKADQVLASAPRAGATALIAADMGAATIDQLRSACDSLRSRAGSAAILLAAESEGKVLLLAAMTPDVVAKGLKAGDLIKEIAPLVGGKGGGKPDLAQGGGPDVAKIAEAISAATTWLKGRLA